VDFINHLFSLKKKSSKSQCNTTFGNSIGQRLGVDNKQYTCSDPLSTANSESSWI